MTCGREIYGNEGNMEQTMELLFRFGGRLRIRLEPFTRFSAASLGGCRNKPNL